MKLKLKDVMELKNEQVVRGAQTLIDKTKDWQTIKAYISNRLADRKLTAKQEEKLKRYQYIFNQLCSGKYTDTEVVNQVMEFFHVEKTQAYEDLNDTKEIAPLFINIKKRSEILIELQINRNYMRKCEEMNDFKQLAALQKNRIALLALLEDDEETPADMFEGHDFEPTFDPELIGAPKVDMMEVLKIINEKRNKKIKIDLFEHLGAQDIEAENNPTDAD